MSTPTVSFSSLLPCGEIQGLTPSGELNRRGRGGRGEKLAQPKIPSASSATSAVKCSCRSNKRGARSFLNRLLVLIGREPDQNLSEELRFHLDMEAPRLAVAALVCAGHAVRDALEECARGVTGDIDSLCPIKPRHPEPADLAICSASCALEGRRCSRPTQIERRGGRARELLDGDLVE